MKLSYRDKVIFIAAIVIVIIVAGIFLFIKPKFEDMKNAKLALEAKQTERSDVEAKINTLPDIVASMKSTAQEVEEIQEYFMVEQEPYLKEQYIREILGNNVETLGMTTQYTSASALQQYVVNPSNVAVCDLFVNGDLYNELPEKVINAYNQVSRKIGGTCTIGVTNVSIDYRDKVDYSGIYKFMDAIKDHGKTIVITDFTKSEDNKSETEVDSSIKLTIYTIYPLNVQKVLEESDEFVFDPSLVPAEETAETAAQ